MLNWFGQLTVGRLAFYFSIYRVPRPFPDLSQVVIAGQLSQMRFDRVAVRSGRFLDFPDTDFSSRLGEFQYLA